MEANEACDGYDYISCHSDDLLIMARDTQRILEQLMEHYEMSKPGLPKYYSIIASEDGEFWVIGSKMHICEAISKAEDILGKLYGIEGYTIRVNTRKGKQNPMSAGSHSEMDETKVLGEEGHNAYQQLIGILQWLCCIGRADIQLAVCSLSHCLACPRKKQLRAVERVFQ